METQPLSPLGEAALAYARLGLAVLPEHEMLTAVACSCGCAHPHCWRRAKHPRLRNWERRFTTGEAQVRAWWTRWPRANIGLGLEASGLVLIDVDPREGYPDRLGELADRFGPAVLDTLTTCTGGRGWHLYFRVPPGVRIPNRKDSLGPGLDVQHAEGLCTIPPSEHHSGATYTWLKGRGPAECPPAPIPPALLEALLRRPPPAWYVKQAPYWLADHAGLSMRTRQRLRGVESLVHRSLARVRALAARAGSR